MKKEKIPDFLLGGLAVALLAAVVGYNLAAAPRYDPDAVVYSAASETSFAPSKTESQLLVNINTATLEQLQELPGIGPVTAQKIVEYRERYGNFVDVYELDEIAGIGEKTLEKLLPYITV